MLEKSEKFLGMKIVILNEVKEMLKELKNNYDI